MYTPYKSVKINNCAEAHMYGYGFENPEWADEHPGLDSNTCVRLFTPVFYEAETSLSGLDGVDHETQVYSFSLSLYYATDDIGSENFIVYYVGGSDFRLFYVGDEDCDVFNLDNTNHENAKDFAVQYEFSYDPA